MMFPFSSRTFFIVALIGLLPVFSFADDQTQFQKLEALFVKGSELVLSDFKDAHVHKGGCIYVKEQNEVAKHFLSVFVDQNPLLGSSVSALPFGDEGKSEVTASGLKKIKTVQHDLVSTIQVESTTKESTALFFASEINNASASTLAYREVINETGTPFLVIRRYCHLSQCWISTNENEKGYFSNAETIEYCYFEKQGKPPVADPIPQPPNYYWSHPVTHQKYYFSPSQIVGSQAPNGCFLVRGMLPSEAELASLVPYMNDILSKVQVVFRNNWTDLTRIDQYGAFTRKLYAFHGRCNVFGSTCYIRDYQKISGSNIPLEFGLICRVY